MVIFDGYDCVFVIDLVWMIVWIVLLWILVGVFGLWMWSVVVVWGGMMVLMMLVLCGNGDVVLEWM